MKTKLLLAAMMLSMSLSLFAQSGICGYDLTWTLDTETGILTISGTGAMTNYEWGDTPWYSYRSSIKTVKIGSRVTSIGEWAFQGCSSLTSVTIPNSVTTIGGYAFVGCSSLPIIDNCRYADTYLVGAKNKTLSTYTIKEGTKWIGDCAFQYCHSLTSITIPNSVTSIGNYAFDGCDGLTAITIPNSVTSIGSYAFEDCSGLTSITIPNSVTTIGKCIFYGCSKLASVMWNAKKCNDFTSSNTPFYYYDNSNTSYNFALSNQITSFTFGDNVEYIPAYLCSGMSNLTSITIPNSVTTIGNSAFSSCSKLTSVTIPNSVTSIGNGAFYGCSLTSVHISDIAAWCKIAFGNYNANPLSYVHNLYLNGTLVTDLVIPDGVTSIGNYAFDDCNLTSVTIPNSVTSIGKWAFGGCSLTSVTIPNSVTTIGDYAFSCSTLTKVTLNSNSIASKAYTYNESHINSIFGLQVKEYIIGNDVTSIGSYAFWDCSGLTSVTIPNSVTSIGDYAFFECSSLTSITIPNSVTSIGNEAFRECSSLTSVTIPNSVTSIGGCAFQDCSSLTSVTIPNSVTSIESYAFQDCSSLSSVTIGNSVTSIGSSAFYNCTSLTSVTIPNSVTTIGYQAFYGCTGLTSVTIPNSMTSIGSHTFTACIGLTSVTIPNSVTSIDDYAFSGCTGLTSITIPNSVTSIGKCAFGGCSSLTYITCEAVNPPTLRNYAFEGVNKSIPLYVPSSAVQQYKWAIGWEDFTNILPIGSQTGDVTTPTVTVTTTSADIAWPQISGAASYELVIKDKSGNVVCTLVFDAEGHLTSLNFGAPDRDNIRKQPQAGTFSFTVTGLKENTEYTYTLTTKDSQGKAVDTKTGTFKTIGVATPVDETERDAAPAPRKLLKNGILYILTPDGTAYDLQGHRLD